MQEDKQKDSKNHNADIGQYLKSQRQKNNISIHQLSELTKIRTENIIAIEENEKIEDIPQTYYRGYIKCYCNFFGIAADQILTHIENITYIPPRNTYPIYKNREQTLKPLKRKKVNHMGSKIILLSILITLSGIFYYEGVHWFQSREAGTEKERINNFEKKKNDLDSIIEIS